MSFRKLLVRSLAVATAVLLFTSGRAVAMLFSPGANLGEGVRALIQQMLYVYVWAFEAALLAPFFARYPLVGRRWRRVPYYLGIGSAAALGPMMVNHAFTYLGPRAARYGDTMGRSLWLEWTASFLLFWVVAAVFQTVEARQRVRDLQGQLAQTELENLKSQLHPHFLFNTLHTISVLMRQDVEAASRVLLKLSDLLRVSLDYSRADRITLQQELDFLEGYLSIERTRRR